MRWADVPFGSERARSAVALAVLGVLACGGEISAPAAEWSLNARRAATYERTCKSCHEKEGTGAPLARAAAAWNERLQQGPAALLEHTISGFRGMPPLGSCMECDEQDLRVLLAFMAGIERPEPGVDWEAGSR